jgi:hypothetical protein
MTDFFKSPKTKTLLWTLCGVLVILIVFGMGLVVGYRRALFASDFGENYYRNFYGDRFGGRPMMGVIVRDPMMMHGVVGKVIDVASSTLSISEPDGDEKFIFVASNTLIRAMNSNVTLGDIKVGNVVTVIGEPNAIGQIAAKFVRVFEASSSPMKMPPTIPSPSQAH